jgi:hypothetical protein
MFRREHHRRIARALELIKIENLLACGCLFGGGTAIVLQLGEYRESVDIDFLCGSIRDYGNIRRGVYDQGSAYLFRDGVKLSRELMQGKSEMRAAIDLEDGERPVKFEIITEGYLGGLLPSQSSVCGVPCLHPQDTMATKLMANADRGLDSAHNFRDLIDLLMVVRTFGPMQEETLRKVRAGYNTTAEQGLLKTVALLDDQPALLQRAFSALALDPDAANYVVEMLRDFDISRVVLPRA